MSHSNSGVLHTGFYYNKKDSLKSRFCIEGHRRMMEYFKDNRLPLKKTGMLVVATN